MLQLLTGSIDFGPPEDVVAVDALADSAARLNRALTELKKRDRGRALVELLEARQEVVGIFINEDATSEYYPPGFSGELTVPSACTGGLVVLDAGRPMKNPGGKPAYLPIEISLAHELGHAEQRLTNPEWFNERFTRQRNESLSGDDRTRAKLEIENDNITRNEKVICEQYGFADTRTSYN